MKGLSIVVIRWNGEYIKNSKPCKHCCEYMKNLGIKKIIYSDDNGNMIREKISELSSNHICLSRRYLGRLKGI